MTTDTDNLLELEHHASFSNWADELWTLTTANIGLNSVFTQLSELNLNDYDVFQQVCIDLF